MHFVAWWASIFFLVIISNLQKYLNGKKWTRMQEFELGFCYLQARFVIVAQQWSTPDIMTKDRKGILSPCQWVESMRIRFHAGGWTMMAVGMCKGRCYSHHGKQEAECRRDQGNRCNLQRHNPCDLLPLTWLHFLKLSEPSKQHLPAGAWDFSKCAHGGLFMLEYQLWDPYMMYVISITELFSINKDNISYGISIVQKITCKTCKEIFTTAKCP